MQHIMKSMGQEMMQDFKPILEVNPEHEIVLKLNDNSDDEAIKASSDFLDEYNVMVEPACGAALSVPYFYSDLIKENDRVLVIVCGGANTQIKTLLNEK